VTLITWRTIDAIARLVSMTAANHPTRILKQTARLDEDVAFSKTHPAQSSAGYMNWLEKNHGTAPNVASITMAAQDQLRKSL
jgi:hypothetical protein